MSEKAEDTDRKEVQDIEEAEEAPDVRDQSTVERSIAGKTEAVQDGSEGGQDRRDDEGKVDGGTEKRRSSGLDGVLENNTNSSVVETPLDTHAITILPSPMNLGTHPADALHAPDSPTTTLIASLRSQVKELADQSHALNTKLIATISRHADLEDLHLHLQSQHVELEQTAKGLEGEKEQWEDSMKTGLLVERSQIKDEMQKLAAGLVEEERRRGSAEERRLQVENEVDDLAASLFDQANTMVAAERMARSQAESRLKSAEENLAVAESAVRDMQQHLQSLPTSAPITSPPPTANSTATRQILASHVPYTEYLTFLAHLRALRPLRESSKAMFPPPAIATLLAQPLLARTIIEDHDPTLRLDAAPDLSYFSRRTVGQAIIAGELIIEPVSASTVIGNSALPAHDIGCSLCGRLVFPLAPTAPQSPAFSQFGPPPNHPPHRSSSRFSLKPFFNATASPNAPGTSPTQSPLASPSPGGMLNISHLSSVYIFRVARPTTTTTGAHEKEAKFYPLCKSGWCLERLRATCALWHFLRTGVMHVVWHGDDGYVLNSEKVAETPSQDIRLSGGNNTEIGGVGETGATISERPTAPERKRSAGWGLGFKLGGDKPGGGGGGGGWFARSGSATPPVSPGLASPALPKYEVDGKEVKSSLDGGGSAVGKETLDEPIELLDEPVKGDQDETGRIEEGVATIQEHEPSPSGPKQPENETEEKKDGKGDDERLATGLYRANSSHSVTTSAAGTEEGSFSTPKGQHQDLTDDAAESKDEDDVSEEHAIESQSDEIHDDEEEEGGKKEAEETQDKSETPLTTTDVPSVVDLTSPISARPGVSPVQRGDGKPPPIPRRAAGRDRGAKRGKSDGEYQNVDNNDKTVDESSEVLVEDKAPGSVIASDETPRAKRAAPPPLPARHPRTPTTHVQELGAQVVNGEKRWIREDGWEERTWKMMITMKEEMWRARVGVGE